MLAKIKAWWTSLFTKNTKQGIDPKPPETLKPEPFLIPSIAVNSPRKLDNKIETMIDDWLLKTRPTKFKDAIARKDANAICGMAAEALSEFNIREKTNSNDGDLVERIQKTNYGSKGDAWCMYFVQTAVAYAEKKTGKVSKIYSSGSCASVRKYSSSLAIDGSKSQYGDIWVWIYSATGLGHTGVFEGWIKYLISAVLNEGNTTAGKVGDSIVREGGGSYQTERAYDTNKKSKMYLGMVIRPF